MTTTVSPAEIPPSTGLAPITEAGPQTLEARRDALKQKLSPNHYRPLSGIIMDGIGSGAARLFHLKSAVPFWASAALIAGLSYFLGLAISLVLGEYNALTGPERQSQVQVSLWAAAMGALVLIVNKVMIDIFLNSFRGSPLNALTTREDIADLEDWLDRNFDFRPPLVVSLVLGSVLGAYLTLQWNQVHGLERVLVGPLVVAVLAAVQAFIAIYYIFPFYLLLPGRLSRYRFNMFKADPSSSEVTRRLSDMFTLIMYITIGYIMVVTLSFLYFNLLNPNTILFLGIFVWLPTVALYVGCQINLSKIITDSKWVMLNDIQAKIENLLSGPETPTPATLEHVEKLMNYHDRIRNTPNSALQFRALFINLNSILLPVITLILANWETIYNLIFKPTAGPPPAP